MFSWFKYLRAKSILKKTKKLLDGNKFSHLKEEEIATLRSNIFQLETHLKEADYEAAYSIAMAIKYSFSPYKSFFHKFYKRATSIAIFFFLIVILLKRMCIEINTIPTGSMRPMFKESDKVVVWQGLFGIRNPFGDFLYLDRDAITHNSVVSFVVKNLPYVDPVEKIIFNMISTDKLYMKRVMGLEGEKVYFYGGNVYCKKNGVIKQIKSTESCKFQNFYVPFINLDGYLKVVHMDKFKQYNYLYFNKLLGVVSKTSNKDLLPTEMVIKTDNGYVTYSENIESSLYKNFGIENYAMVYLLEDDNGNNSLVFLHHPHISNKKRSENCIEYSPGLYCYYSKLKLSKDAIDKLYSNLYTSRFKIFNQKIYDLHGNHNNWGPELFLVEDGIYEFYNGVAYRVKKFGVLSKLPKNHPIYSYQNMLTLFNSGINCSNNKTRSSRYAYFNNGDLYISGKLLLNKDDIALAEYITKEEQIQNHLPFIDNIMGDENIITGLIEKYGVEIQNGDVLVLGDNCSVSFDSRFFGTVPIKNLRGAPVFRIWPIQEGWGILANNIIINKISFIATFILAIFVVIACYLYPDD